ncbi:hypothetical protein EVJ30_13015 [Exiguobacterium sp. SH5S13]|uniref:hypothetical protein n=1 Tax=Exiguobacterium sp. SH5S13 TaxID=2510959 RepID=UPI00103DA42B|nr:hypothetical protein [Exiguobacterium sp. SH5S13]TCI50365.1 hypothetical protein EVJ30_13015 [Exiguobacterium sp. SH5S13]
MVKRLEKITDSILSGIKVLLEKNNIIIIHQILFWFVVCLVTVIYRNVPIRKELLPQGATSIIDLTSLGLIVLLITIINQITIYKKADDLHKSKYFTFYVASQNFLKLSFKHLLFKCEEIFIKVFMNLSAIKRSEIKKFILEDIRKTISLNSFFVVMFYVFNFFYAYIFFEINTSFNSLKEIVSTVTLFLIWLTWFSSILISYIICSKKKDRIIALILSIFLVIYELSPDLYSSLNILEDVGNTLFRIVIISLLVILLYPFAWFITYIVTKPYSFFGQEYEDAKTMKMRIENKIILESFLRHNQDLTIQDTDLKVKLLENIHRHHQSLRIKDHLKTLVVDSTPIFKETDFENITKKFLLPVDKMKSARAEYIFRRNRDNLRIALSTLIIFFIIYIALKYFTPESWGDSIFINFKDITFTLVFLRLLLRAFEISHTFYLDIQDGFEDKKSSLTKRDRAKLALNSLLEIIIFSIILNFIFYIYDLDKEPSISPIYQEFIRLMNLILSTGSVSLFNISFDNVKDVVTTFSPEKILPRIVHITQVTTSIVLLTVCLGAYINSNTKERKIQIQNQKNRLVMIEKSASGYQKVIFTLTKYQDIHYLMSEIRNLYSKGKITTEDFNEYDKAIRNYTLIVKKPYDEIDKN